MNDFSLTFDREYCLEMLEKLLSIDSTTGQYVEIEEFVCSTLRGMGCAFARTHKGGVIADLGGEGDALVVTAHLDDIGLMVRHIRSNGYIEVCPVGGLYPFYCVTENVRVYTRDDRVYTGSVCRTPGSIHVTEDEIRKTLPDFNTNVCVILDEDVSSAADVAKLGIQTGDIVALEPRFRVENGYVKSRFIDDKAAAAILLSVIKQMKEKGISPRRRVYFYFAMYEEIGHGTTFLPSETRDILAVDIAPTGEKQTSNERKVTIFAKDSRFPYHYGMTNELIECAKSAGVDHVVDIFTPHYGTDGDGSVLAGYDIRHGAIGFGTLNSHGYERTHIDGLKNTFDLLCAYILK